MSEITKNSLPRLTVDDVTILFSGDSGDGIQIIGDRFAYSSSIFGNDISCFPDFPAEIRAPAGTLAGVSGYKLCFSSHAIQAPGDYLDALVAFNPAALRHNIDALEDNGILVVNSDSFTEKDWLKAGYDTDPLLSEDSKKYRIVKVPMTTLTMESVSELGIPRRKALLCKNMFALGICSWLYERPLPLLSEWLAEKFATRPDIRDANIAALKAGYHYADTIELAGSGFHVEPAPMVMGKYRHINGNEALALGAVAASLKLGKELLFASYPITPSSDVLHHLAKYKNFGVTTFQTEDEIAAMSAAIGAAFAGNLGLTSTSGPGLDLKQEALGLAVMAELPVVVYDVQRAGPSTGLPTKTEQADLLAAMYGRHGECPVPVLCPVSPSDCFTLAIEAFRIAVTYMTPVIVLSDGYLANSSEPWLIPSEQYLDEMDLPDIPLPTIDASRKRAPETLAKPWVWPGQAGYEYRAGGLEKDLHTSNISYEPDNHQKMVDLRAGKIERIQLTIPALDQESFPGGDLLVVGWGGTKGSLFTAVDLLTQQGYKVDLLQLRYILPMQQGVGDVLTRYKKILVCELNKGQLNMILKATFDIRPEVLQNVSGMPFKVETITRRCLALLTDMNSD